MRALGFLTEVKHVAEQERQRQSAAPRLLGGERERRVHRRRVRVVVVSENTNLAAAKFLQLRAALGKLQLAPRGLELRRATPEKTEHRAGQERVLPGVRVLERDAGRDRRRRNEVNRCAVALQERVRFGRKERSPPRFRHVEQNSLLGVDGLEVFEMVEMLFADAGEAGYVGRDELGVALHVARAVDADLNNGDFGVRAKFLQGARNAELAVLRLLRSNGAKFGLAEGGKEFLGGCLPVASTDGDNFGFRFLAERVGELAVGAVRVGDFDEPRVRARIVRANHRRGDSRPEEAFDEVMPIRFVALERDENAFGGDESRIGGEECGKVDETLNHVSIVTGARRGFPRAHLKNYRPTPDVPPGDDGLPVPASVPASVPVASSFGAPVVP